MKAYILTEDDLQRLLDSLDRNPAHGESGGSTVVHDVMQRNAHEDAHRFYNFQVRRWLESVKK